MKYLIMTVSKEHLNPLSSDCMHSNKSDEPFLDRERLKERTGSDEEVVLEEEIG